MSQESQHPMPTGSLDKYRINIDCNAFSAAVFWARVVSSENESLLTGYTKHTFFEIQYALEGRIVITVGDNDRFTLDKSDFIVIPPDTYHQIVDGDDTGARFIMAFSLVPKAGHAHDALLRTNATPHKESPLLRQLLTLTLQKGENDTPYTADTLSGLIESFLCELCDILSPTKAPSTDNAQKLSDGAQRVGEMLQFIREHHGIGITVAGMAKQFGISERHLNRLFHAEAQTSVREAINHEKLRYIEELIASTPLSLGEISALCGFSDEYAMNKFFKRYNRTRLSDYRHTARHTFTS